MNINEMIVKTLGSGDTLGSVSSFLGLNQEQTKGAMSAAVPSLLAGLTHLSSTSQGAQQLSGAIARQDPGLLDNLSGAISGQGTQLAEQGSNALGSLLGGGMTSKLSGVLARFTGVGEGATGKLLGLLAPMILGFLGKQQKTLGLDAGGMANLLAGQKDNIRSAMPVGLSAMLSSALPSVSGFFNNARSSVPEVEAAPALPQRPRVVERERAEYGMTAPRPSLMRWAIPAVLGLLAIALFAMWSNRNRASREAELARTMAVPSERVVTMPDVSKTLATDVSQLVTQATGALSGIKDRAGAEAAVPKLKEINEKLAGLQSAQARLPEATRTYVRSSVNPLVARLKEAVQPLLSIPGVGETIRPVAEEMFGRLDALTQ